MKREVVCVDETESVLDAARRMREANVGLLPVCDPDQKVVGVLTDRDIAIRVCADGRQPETTQIRDVMTLKIVACRAEDELRSAEELMKTHHKSRILITDGQGHMSGIISLSDIARHEEPQRTVETLRGVIARQSERQRPGPQEQSPEPIPLPPG